MEREIIVVGAGPSGSTTAIELAQAGRDVLLIDSQAFPRDKTCGDGIPSKSLDHLYDLGLKETFEKENFFKVTHILIAADEKTTFETNLKLSPKHKVPSRVIPRARFDHIVQQHALASGAEFFLGRVQKPLLESGQVVGVEVTSNGKTQQIRSKIVVGADGVTSAIVRALRPPLYRHADTHRAVALRAYVNGFIDFLPRVEFYFYRELLPGYAWVFPISKNEANVGLGMRLDRFRRDKHNLEEMLEVFLNLPFMKSRLIKGGSVQNISTWQLNFGSQKNLRHAYDGALLVGDAAGLINPLTGGGIDNAILSGRLAAQTIANAFQQNDFSYKSLQGYEKKLYDILWKDSRRAYFFNQVMTHFPITVKWLLSLMTKDSNFARNFLDKL